MTPTPAPAPRPSFTPPVGCSPIDPRPDCHPPAPALPAPPAPATTAGPPPSDRFHIETPPLNPLDDTHQQGGFDLGWLDLTAWLAWVAPVATTAAAVAVLALGMVGSAATWWTTDGRTLRNYTVGSLLLPAVSMLASWSPVAPLEWCAAGAHAVAGGDWSGVRLMLAAVVPAAFTVSTLVWAHHELKVATVGLKSLAANERARHRMTVRRNAAAARAARFGAPMSAGDGVVLGVHAEQTSQRPRGLWSELTARHQSWIVVPHKASRRHVCVVGTTGMGKTTLLLRLALAMFSSEWRAWWRWRLVPGARNSCKRPLLIVLSCKGGQSDIEFGTDLRQAMIAAGIDRDRTASVPADDRLDMFSMGARDMRAVVAALMGVGESSATSEGQHFEELRKRVTSLVVDAPAGPPRSTAELLDRLHPDRLLAAWGGDPQIKRQIDALQEEKVPQLDEALIKFSNLFDTLKDTQGRGLFEGGVSLADLDMLYVTVPGTVDPDSARAQVAAVIAMVMQYASGTHGRSITLIVDEASAVATRAGGIDLIGVAERGRSQGVSVIFSAQSVEGLGPDEQSQRRLIKSSAGGSLLGYTEDPDFMCKVYGPIRSVSSTRHLIKGQRHGDEGQSQVEEKWLVDPNRIRAMDTGDICYVRGGRAVWGRVVPVTPSTITRLPGTRTDTSAAPQASTVTA